MSARQTEVAKSIADQVRAEVGAAQSSFADALRRIRQSIGAAGIGPDEVLGSTALFNGPDPKPVEAGWIAPNASIFASVGGMIWSCQLPAGCVTCEIGPGDGTMARFMLDNYRPTQLHLLDARFDRLAPDVQSHPSVKLHAGDPVELLHAIEDGTLAFALVDGPTSYHGSKRLLAALLPKLKPAGRVIVRNYTGWSVLSGLPYGIPAVVHELAASGAVQIAGLVPNARGYHQILLRKAGIETPEGASDSTAVARRPTRTARRSEPSSLLARAESSDAGVVTEDLHKRLVSTLRACLPRAASVLVATTGDPQSLGLKVQRVAAFRIGDEGKARAPGEASSPADAGAEDAPGSSEGPFGRLQSRIAEGWTHLVIPSPSFAALDREPAFSEQLRRSCRLVHLDDAVAIVALREQSSWAELDAFVADFRIREGRPPAILDWNSGWRLGATMSGTPVFSPEAPELPELPFVDRSVDVVAVPAGDPGRLREAQRVASSAIVELERTAGAPIVRITLQSNAAPPRDPLKVMPAKEAEGLRLDGRRILICSYYLPQPDCDSYSRRLFHFVHFLRDAGCSVTCVARNPLGFDAFSEQLTSRGVEVHLGLDPASVAELAREKRFDAALLGFWNTAASLLRPLRDAAPATRLIIDSGDVHFLRHARKAMRAGDGYPGRLDASFAEATAAEIDLYGAADAVLAVSEKEADLVADLIGEHACRSAAGAPRSFAVPDSEDYEASSTPLASRRGMLIVGNYEHAPNAEALEYLCRQILPHVDPAILDLHPVYVVGSNMSDEVRKLANGTPGVRLVGWVPSMQPWLEQVRLSIVPLLHGAGTKRKMIQALSIGTPTVATSVGLEGFGLSNGQGVLVADDPLAFASDLTRVLTDDSLWLRLANAGCETMRERHSHRVARERLIRALQSILVAPRRRSAPPKSLPAAAYVDAVPTACAFEGLTAAHLVTRPAGRDTGDKPAISVVIPTRNRAPLLYEALESLVGQTADRSSFEVVVVNDGSTDDTSEVCRRFTDRLRLVQVEGPACGIGRAKNVGMEVARADLILSFDDDDIADPGLVSAHLSAHGRYPLEHVAVLGFTDWHPRLAITEVMRYVIGIGHDLFSYTYLQDGQLLDHTWFWGGRSSCKKSLIMRAGGFRSDFTFGSEDIEAGYRISRMVADERRSMGASCEHPGLSVVFRRDAVQRMIRPLTFEDVCRRCERQGRSQWQYSRFYDDPSVHAWCQLATAETRFEESRELLSERIARVHELEGLLATAEESACGSIRDELHRLYRWTFDAFKARGIIEAQRTMGSA